MERLVEVVRAHALKGFLGRRRIDALVVLDAFGEGGRQGQIGGSEFFTEHSAIQEHRFVGFVGDGLLLLGLGPARFDAMEFGQLGPGDGRVRRRRCHQDQVGTRLRGGDKRGVARQGRRSRDDQA